MIHSSTCQIQKDNDNTIGRGREADGLSVDVDGGNDRLVGRIWKETTQFLNKHHVMEEGGEEETKMEANIKFWALRYREGLAEEFDWRGEWAKEEGLSWLVGGNATAGKVCDGRIFGEYLSSLLSKNKNEQ